MTMNTGCVVKKPFVHSLDSESAEF